MATLRDIKQRIIGVKNTQQITKAMKMVSAAKLRRAQENILNARPYSRKISEVLTNLLQSVSGYSHPLLEKRDVKKVALIVITSDRGLCGSFNMNVIREATGLIHDGELAEYRRNKALSLYCLGKKGLDIFSKQHVEIAGRYPGIFSHLKFETASQLANELMFKFQNGEYDRVMVVYNEFKSVMQQKLVVEQLLPVVPKEQKHVSQSKADFIFEPDKTSIIENMLPKHVKSQLWRMLLESFAAELGARMTAMDLATENAKELIRQLQLKYNKERQASITKELIEIVSGANALKG